MAFKLPRDAWRWIYTADKMISEYQTGQAENKVQHNADFMGIPRTGKNHLKCIMEEWGMRSDNIKTIFPHASKPGHLQEILQFMIPFGYFFERDAEEELDLVRENLEGGEYDSHELSHQDLDGFEFLTLGEKIETLGELIGEESNQAVISHLREARSNYEEINKYLDMWSDNIVNQRGVPRTIKNAYREKGDDGKMTYTLSDSFNMEVFVPISTAMPEGIEYPDFFKPYGIPVDDFKKWDFSESLRIIFGGRNFDSYRKLFDKVIDVGDASVTDLKAPDVQVGRPHVETVSFADMEWEILNTEENPQQVMDRFKMAWTQMFNKRGILTGSDYENDLRSQLKESLLDEDVESIVLYTGFLQNTTIKKFVMTHFMQTYESIIDNLTPAEERQIDRKFVIDIVEAQVVIQRRTDFNKLSDADKQFNSFMSNFIEQSGHINTDVWADAKPNTINDLIPANTEHSFITQIKQRDWEDLFRGLSSDLKNDCKTAFQNRDYQEFTLYGKGFILLTEGRVTDWRKPSNATDFPGSPTYGYRHLTPRMTTMRPVPFSNDDPSFFTEEMGYKEMGRTILFDDYVADLMGMWEESDKPEIERKDKEQERQRQKEAEEQKERKEMLEDMVRERLRAMVSENGVPDSWRNYLSDIKEEKEISFGIRALEKWTKDVRDELEEKASMRPEEELDYKQVADELKRDLKFVFGAKSSERKRDRAEEYIIENYDVNEGYAEEVAERAVSKAMTDLEFEGIIDQSHNVKVEGESREEQMERYKELMGLNVQEAEEDSEPEPEPPGESWSCSCGRENEGDRTVCGSCGKEYAEVADNG